MNAKATIGVPVYNAAATLRRAVEGALARTRPADLIHISDDASTDGTAALGRDLAARHPSVIYTRHDASLGLSGDFGHLLERADTECFMWPAADDHIEAAYVERALAALERDPGLVACVSRAVFVHPDGASRPVGGAFPLMADTVTNPAAYLSGPSDNTRIFALYRTEALRRAFPPRYFHAYDWAIAAGTLLHGRHMELPETLMTRDETPAIAYVKAVRRDNPTAIGQLLPVLGMTLDLIRRRRIPLRWPVVEPLLRLNLEMHLTYALVFHPRHGEAVGRVLRPHVLWRLWPSRSDPSRRAGSWGIARAMPEKAHPEGRDEVQQVAPVRSGVCASRDPSIQDVKQAANSPPSSAATTSPSVSWLGMPRAWGKKRSKNARCTTPRRRISTKPSAPASVPQSTTTAPPAIGVPAIGVSTLSESPGWTTFHLAAGPTTPRSDPAKTLPPRPPCPPPPRGGDATPRHSRPDVNVKPRLQAIAPRRPG